MLHLFQSNHYETLTEALLDDIETSQEKDELWIPWQIIVPNSAVRRRLELDLASRHDICINIEFAYLEQWLWNQINRIYKDVPQYSPFTPDRLVWRCYRLLCDAVDFNDIKHKKCNLQSNTPWFASPRLTKYLLSSNDTMRYELARRIANVMNHYLNYRPEWLSTWQTGESILRNDITKILESVFDDEKWQSSLWRAITGEVVGEKMLPVHNFLLGGYDSSLETIARMCLPTSVSIFTLPIITPLHASLLHKLSIWIDVRIYSLNPCKKLWFYVKNEEIQVEIQRIYQHPFLTEWGKQIGARLHVLNKLTQSVSSSKTANFVENNLSTYLAYIQNTILNPQYKLIFSGETLNTHGIEVHVCHSLTRQLEVLHNRLLKLLNEDNSLKLSDVLIVIPNISIAEPLINSVFGMSDLERTVHIPYKITGLRASHTNLIIRVILDWLTLPDRQISALELIEWLRIDEIATCYKIDEVDLKVIERWLSKAGGKRGLSNRCHSNTDVNNIPRHTFSDALKRLFLGYAMQDGTGPIGIYLPINTFEGSESELLGRLTCFIDNLDSFSCLIAQDHTPKEWNNILSNMLSCFFNFSSAYSDTLNNIRDTLSAMFDAMIESAADKSISAPVVRAGLISEFDRSIPGGVPHGCVTFSSMASLRGLAYRVICLLDMDDGALSCYFKRMDEFDLITILPKLGDSQRQDDSRSLFLDFLLAARDSLFIFYTGRSINDNSPLPPSIVVEELLDYLADISAGLNASGDMLNTARRSFIIEHPLQSFSPSYFEETDQLFSYNTEHASIATLLISNEESDCTSNDITPFFSQPLPRESVEPISFIDFDLFWRYPTRALLRDRLGIVLADMQSKQLDNEPFELDYAGSYVLADRILPILIKSGETSAINHARRIINASHELPAGATGKAWRDRVFCTLMQLAEKVRHALSDGEVCLPFELEIFTKWPHVSCPLFCSDNTVLARDATAEPLLLYGTINRLTPSGQVIYRYARPGARDYISAWLIHLVYCAILPDGPRRTLWFGSNNSAFEFIEVESPLRYLSSLTALFRAGRRMPLPFFPHSAWSWIKSSKTRSANFLINDRLASESRDPEFETAWRGIDLSSLNESFYALARVMFDPIIEHLLEVK